MPETMLILGALAAGVACVALLVVAWRVATGDDEVGNLVAIALIALVLAYLLATAGGWKP